MPSLRWVAPDTATAKSFHLFKKITTIGRSEDNDVYLPVEGVLPHHGHILLSGKHFVLSSLIKGSPVYVNGKRKRTHKLQHGDTLQVGPLLLRFNLHDDLREVDHAKTVEDINTLRKLYEFSAVLMRDSDLDSILERLMDHVITVTRADKGFLIFLESGEPVAKVARNVNKENIADEQSRISDSIVRRVIDSEQPIIVSDALHHPDFRESRSVVNLKLCSIMCVPMMDRGKLLGALYVGNDNVANLFTPESLEILTIYASQASMIVHNALMLNELKLDVKRLKDSIRQKAFGEIIGACDSMVDIFNKIRKVAGTDISILIQGETGTGKELIAKEIHNRSNRKNGPFVTINCGAIPENLLESELFGHVKGAFTGAVSTVAGKFQYANGGTLFLDEIGEMPLNLQVKLLRSIQDRVVTKVGDTRPEKVDIRILAASNKNLAEEIKYNKFREDLYYRLNVIALELPPLRERGEDLVLIAKFLLDKYLKELGGDTKAFSAEALAAMQRHDWPGNIRELENRIKKAVVFSEEPLITSEDLDFREEPECTVLPLTDAKEKFQRDYINKVLRLNHGNRTKTARDLKVDPRTIFRHLERERLERQVQKARRQS